MKKLLLALCLLSPAAFAANYGEPMPEGEATPIAASALGRPARARIGRSSGGVSAAV